MSFLGKTPREIALELEVKDLRRKLVYYEMEERYRAKEYPSVSPVADGSLDLGTINVKDIAPRIMLPKTAQITAALEAGMDIRVEARTFPPKGDGIGQAYYLSGMELDTANQAQLLGMMHERFLTELGSFIKKHS
jgi:hypothetical protein